MKRILEGILTAFCIALAIIAFLAISAMLTYAQCALVDAAGGACVVVSR